MKLNLILDENMVKSKLRLLPMIIGTISPITLLFTIPAILGPWTVAVDNTKKVSPREFSIGKKFFIYFIRHKNRIIFISYIVVIWECKFNV